jgi:hypothetical protein
MALPSNLSTITITGQYLNFQGAPILGQVKIYPSTLLIDQAAKDIIVPATITTDLNKTDGTFSVTVPVTNDPDATPINFTYAFEEAFIGGSTYFISLPISLGSTVDISTLRADKNLISYYQPVAYSLWPGLVSRVVIQEAAYANPTAAQSDGTYGSLKLYFDTYASMASTWATYASAVKPTLIFSNARITTLLNKVANLENYSANSTELIETTNGGSVTRNTYAAHAAKYGNYQNWSNQYATYNTLTSAYVTWTYAQLGAVLSDFNKALTGLVTDTSSITDQWLKLTRRLGGYDYGSLTLQSQYQGTTYAGLASTYSTYGALGSSSFYFYVRDSADRIQMAANHPHPLLMREKQYGINV